MHSIIFVGCSVLVFFAIVANLAIWAEHLTGWSGVPRKVRLIAALFPFIFLGISYYEFPAASYESSLEKVSAAQQEVDKYTSLQAEFPKLDFSKELALAKKDLTEKEKALKTSEQLLAKRPRITIKWD